MDIKRYETGTRMSQAVVCGGLAFLAGQVAADAPGAPVAGQTRNILERIDALLAKIGTDKTKILSATIWLADIATFQEMNAVWDAWAPVGHAPARATVQAKLAEPQYAVEIGIIACMSTVVSI
jgi:enamine deaminase RidA (YjgF/YER057c/UK114 family)